MSVTSLCGPCGIGVMGKEAKEFIDTLKKGGFSVWQVLPTEHTGGFYSPYDCFSAYAGDPLLIDPRYLLDKGWVTQEEYNERIDGLDLYSVDYNIVDERQTRLLRIAYNRLTDRSFYETYNPHWLMNYSLFMVIRDLQDMKSWTEWDDGLRMYKKSELIRIEKEYSRELDFYRFIQWLFHEQWNEMKAYANDKGISILGDMPIYVSLDSADVWSNREMFMINKDCKLLSVSGCPPDYFTPDGQKWGNPVYDWDELKREGYKWWINRMRASIERYDMVRLDHFRGFESFWSVPAEDKTARNGKWLKGPGMDLFKAIERELGHLPILAENLGVITEEVEELLEDSGFLGMGVLQFGFMGDSRHLPHSFNEKTVAYTGTHDNTTLLDWMYCLDDYNRKRALAYCGFEGDWGAGGASSGICHAWMRTLWQSGAKIVIAPIQDMLGYGRDTRMNIPGSAEGNWRFRVSENAMKELDLRFFAELNDLYER